MSYPALRFKRAAMRLCGERTRWRVFHRGVLLGEVWSFYTGGWANAGGSGYSTRYEAGYSLWMARRAS